MKRLGKTLTDTDTSQFKGIVDVAGDVKLAEAKLFLRRG